MAEFKRLATFSFSHKDGVKWGLLDGLLTVILSTDILAIRLAGSQ